jgi:hypothetical protein
MKAMRIAVLGLAATVTVVLLASGVPTRATDWCLGGICQEWVARYNGPANGNDQALAIAVDGAGNVYVTGSSGGVGTGSDYLTIKYDANRNKEWEARYSGPGNGTDEARAIALDGVGNVYVTGSSQGVATGPDYATVKYLPDGTQGWVARYDGPAGATDEAYAIAVDAGYVYVTGASAGVGTGSDYLTIKYDASDGSEVWMSPARYDGPAGASDIAYAIAVDAGYVYVTGSSVGVGTGSEYATIKYDASDGAEEWAARYDGPASNSDRATDVAVDGGYVYVTGDSIGVGTGSDYATIKYDASDGSEVWTTAARYDGPASSTDEANAIAVDGGYVYVTGSSEGAATASDYATIKYDASDGSEVWTTPARYDAGGDAAYAIAVDGTGNVYVTGSSGSTGRDYATVKYLPAGTEAWVTRYNGPGNGNDGATALAVDGAGNVYVTGASPGSGTGYDYATIKYMPDSDVDGFSDARETYVGTDPADNCGLNAWPLDMNSDSFISFTGDIIRFVGRMGFINTDPGWTPAHQRLDLDGDTAISTYGDIYSMYRGMISRTCDGGTPPPPSRPPWAPAVLMAIDPETTSNSANTLGRTEACVRIDVDPGDFGDGVADHTIDVYVKGDTQAPTTYDAWFYYEPGLVDPVPVLVDPETWNDTIKLPGAGAFTTDIAAVSRFNAGAAYMSGGSGTAGNGTLVRVNLDVIGAGLASFNFAFARNAYWSVAGVHDLTTLSGQLALAINTDCNTDRALELLGASVVGDDLSDASDADDDNDGFSDVVEQYLGTEPLDNCPNWPPGPGGNAWPADIDADGMLSVTGDVYNYVERLGAKSGPSAYCPGPLLGNWSQRLDLNKSCDISVTGDIYYYVNRLGEKCN